MEQKQRIFFDMDGVLAKWESCSLEETFAHGFFLSREPVENVIKAVKMLCNDDDIDVYILSATYEDHDNHSLAEKRLWNQMHTDIPLEKQIYVPYGQNKSDGLDIKTYDILVDDFSKNLREWPGTTIKLYNGINGTKGSWNGFSCHSNMRADLLYLQLRAIANIVR